MKAGQKLQLINIMQRISIIFFLYVISSTVYAQGRFTLKNKSELLDTLNKYYSTFSLDGKQTHKNEISIIIGTPTKPKNNVLLSDSVILVNIVHSNGSKLSGTIIIEIDPIKGYYMFSSRYHESINGSRHGFESRTLGWWEIIDKDAPNYVYSPKKIAFMVKQ